MLGIQPDLHEDHWRTIKKTYLGKLLGAFQTSSISELSVRAWSYNTITVGGPASEYNISVLHRNDNIISIYSR